MTNKLRATGCGPLCATNPGYQRHCRRGEDPCQVSKTAHAEHAKAYRGGSRVRDLYDHLSRMSVSDCIDEIARVLHGPHA